MLDALDRLQSNQASDKVGEKHGNFPETSGSFFKVEKLTNTDIMR